MFKEFHLTITIGTKDTLIYKRLNGIIFHIQNLWLLIKYLPSFQFLLNYWKSHLTRTDFLVLSQFSVRYRIEIMAQTAVCIDVRS